MIYCPQCGHQNEDSAKFCGQCGVEISSAEKTQTFAPPEIEVEEEIPVAEETWEETPILLVKKGPNIGEKFSLIKEEIILGRDPQSDIFLNDITVSRKHAQIRLQGNNYQIIDAGSLNGT